MRRLAAVLLGNLALIAATVASAADRPNAGAWLDDMATAINSLNYHGTVVVARDADIDVLEVFHKADASGRREKIITLNGPAREIIRNGDSVRAIFADKSSVSIDARITEGLFQAVPYNRVIGTNPNYGLIVLGYDRVAGFKTIVIQIKPKDGLRFGQKLWLELETAMLLKTVTLDEDDHIREQLSFTSIDLGGAISERDLMPTLISPNAVELEISTLDEVAVRPSDQTYTASQWRVGAMPAGFFMVRQVNSANQEKRNLQHLVLTDGLASVSVYIEAIDSGSRPITGYKELGGLHVYGQRRDGYNITAIGEVPVKTLHMVVSSVKRISAVADQ